MENLIKNYDVFKHLRTQWELNSAEDIHIVKKELWEWLKAVLSESSWTYLQDPSIVLRLAATFRSIISEVRTLTANSDFQDLKVSMNTVAWEAVSLMLDHQSCEEWLSAIEDWTIYGLSKASIYEVSDRDALKEYEIFSALIDAVVDIGSDISAPSTSTDLERLSPEISMLTACLGPIAIYAKFKQIVAVVRNDFMESLSKTLQTTSVIMKNATLKCTVVKKHQFQQNITNGNLFYALLCTPENLIFSDSDFTPISLDHQARLAAVSKARLIFQNGYDKSMAFASSAIEQLKNNLGVCSFMLHQSLELLARTSLRVFADYEKKTHYLRVLFRDGQSLLSGLERDVRCAVAQENIIELLDECYIKGRYEMDPVLSRSQLTSLAKTIMSAIQTHQIAMQESLNSVEIACTSNDCGGDLYMDTARS